MDAIPNAEMDEHFALLKREFRTALVLVPLSVRGTIAAHYDSLCEFVELLIGEIRAYHAHQPLASPAGSTESMPAAFGLPQSPSVLFNDLESELFTKPKPEPPGSPTVELVLDDIRQIEEPFILPNEFRSAEIPVESAEATNKKVKERRATRKKQRVHPELQCPDCGKGFKLQGSLRRHIRVFHRPPAAKPFECDVCGTKFEKEGILVFHRLNVHKIQPDKDYGICKLCGKNCRTASDLRWHMQFHETEHNIKCARCLAAFTSFHYLRQHLKTVHSTDQFVCEVCGYTAKHLNLLSHHSRIHSTECNYKCRLCEKKYRLAVTLRQHVKRVHEKARPYMCEQCGMAFSENKKLKYHVYTHTGERPYCCPLCGKPFSRPDNVRTHIRSCARRAGLDEETRASLTVVKLDPANSMFPKRPRRKRRWVKRPKDLPRGWDGEVAGTDQVAIFDSVLIAEEQQASTSSALMM